MYKDRLEILTLPETPDIKEIRRRVKDIPVALIIPPSPFLADERVFPFLGPAKVATELKRPIDENTPGNYVEFLDLAGYANYKDIVRDYVSNSSIRTIGITATTPQIPTAVEVVKTIREYAPDATIILGGPHATLTHAAMTNDKKENRIGRGTHAFSQLTNLFDVIVVGDGEEAIFQAIDPERESQIIDASSLQSPLFMKRGELDRFLPPDRTLIDMDSYHYHIDGKRAFSVIGQLGCPFECGFCGGRDSQVFRIARTRSVANIIDEIENIVEPSLLTANPYEAVMFYDDELNVNPGNLEDLCKGLIDMQDRQGIEMRFRGFVKAELFTQEQANLMYKAGFRVLLSGVESGSNKILSAMRKHTSRDINARCADYAHQAGLAFKSLMSIGHPGESAETISESVDWAKTYLVKGDDIDWTIITQYPGSPYFDKSVFDEDKEAWLYQVQNKKTGETLRLWSREVDYAKDANYYKGVPGEYTAYVWTDFLNPVDLVKLRDQAEIETRSFLKLPMVSHSSTMQFEHSMGQGIPSRILRKSR